MSLKRSLAGLGLMFLVGCGGAGETPSSVAPVSNGLPYAVEGVTLEDFTGQSGEVTVVGHFLDYASGVPQIVIERATLEVAAFQGEGPLLNVDPNMTLRINGEELVFVNGTATDSTGKIWSAYIDTTGTVSGTAGIYHYDYGSGPQAFDSEAVFAFGFLTDPDELQVRSLSASYSGDWFGYGVVTDGAGGIVQNEAIGGGALTLVADFDVGEVSGSITGSYDSFGRVDGAVEAGLWEENAMATEIALTCGAGEACSSDSMLGGAFFGVGGSEISGAIGFDARRTISGVTRRLVSSAGYTLTEETDP